MSDHASYLGISVAQWVEALHSTDPLERRLAAHALGEVGPAAADVVSDVGALLEDPVPFVRVWGAAALARLAPNRTESIAALLAGMKDEVAFVRSLAAWHLGRLGPEFAGIEESVPILRELLRDGNPNVRLKPPWR